jgi:regulator of protease activity HflC (stomatin/prohibitin superfamily)
MRALMLVAVVVFLSLAGACSACRSVTIPQGEVAVLIDTPLVFGHGGVQTQAIGTGQKWVWRTTYPIFVNMQPFKHDANFDDMNSSDGVPLDFHAQANFRVIDAVSLIRDFGPQWYENNLAKPFESYTRRAVNRHTEPSITTAIGADGKPLEGKPALDTIDDEVTAGLNAEITKLKLPVILTDLTLGKANPPKEILDQRTLTARERQRVQTERQGKLAEDERRAKEQARAEADLAYNQKMGLSPAQFVELSRIAAIRDCGGKCTVIIGSPAGVVVP